MREIAAMEPHTILWDVEVRGFCARKQFSDVITYSVSCRTRDGQKRKVASGAQDDDEQFMRGPRA